MLLEDLTKLHPGQRLFIYRALVRNQSSKPDVLVPVNSYSSPTDMPICADS